MARPYDDSRTGGIPDMDTPDTTHKHVVKQASANYFCYDANGNMTKRNATSAACSNGDVLAYDVENHLTQVVKGSTTTNYGYRCNSLSRGFATNFQNS